MQKAEHICIAPSHSRRAQFWKDTLSKNKKTLTHYSYIDLIHGKINLDTSTSYIIRIESSGEDFETYKAILLLGCDTSTEKEKINNLTEDFGQVANFALWKKGWTRLLHKVNELKNQYTIQFINDPLSIDKTFDKQYTQQLAIANNINCPTQLQNCTTYTALITLMKSKDIPQVFIKPLAGSSASGIMAFKYYSEEKQILYTTLLKKGEKYYNSLKLITYRDPKEIREVINYQISQQPIIEKWIPKWRHHGLNIDFRVVVINRKAEYVLPRGSKHMITNLHLGNTKLTIENSGITPTQLLQIKSTAEKAMALFPHLFYAGVDVLLNRKGNQTYLLEINAFGDMLLQLQNEKGQNVYELEYEKIQQ